MKILLAAILLIGMALSGCSNVRVYTVEKNRVDQAEAGNKGYIMGSPSAIPPEGEVPKRTMFVVDIEVPILPGEKGYKPGEMTKFRQKDKSKQAEKEVVVTEETVIIEETPVSFSEEVIEEEWVK